MPEFPVTALNQVKRAPRRAQYDRAAVYAIVDEAPVCHVGFVQDGQPFVLPVNHARQGDTLYLHGAPASRLLRHIAAGHPVCVSVTLVDGLVLARSACNHSMNYRSAVLFGHGRAVESDAEKLQALELLTERLAPGRWGQVRPPTRRELDATAVVAIDVDSASAKARSGPPGDEPEPDIVVVGDVNADLIARFPAYPAEGKDALADEIEFHCGGSAANTARALARLGFGVSLLSRVGPDPWASLVLRSLEGAGVRLDGVQRDPAVMTGLVYIVVTPGGERTMLSYRGANARTDPALIPEGAFRQARHLHLSGYALLAEPQRSAALRALELAESHGLTISLDPGMAPASTDEVRALLPRVDLLLPTLAEAQALTGLDSPADCVRALLERGVATVAVKLGPEGCLIGQGDELLRAPAFPVEARDSTGAGDSFDAGAIAGFLSGLDRPSTAVLANALGALAASHLGAGGEALTPGAAVALLEQQLGTAADSAYGARPASRRAIEGALSLLLALNQ